MSTHIDPSEIRILELALDHFDGKCRELDAAYVDVVQAARRVFILARAGEHSAAPPPVAKPAKPAASPPVTRANATSMGYTGDSCRRCGSFALQRTGTCAVCQQCGESAGCS